MVLCPVVLRRIVFTSFGIHGNRHGFLAGAINHGRRKPRARKPASFVFPARVRGSAAIVISLSFLLSIAMPSSEIERLWITAAPGRPASAVYTNSVLTLSILMDATGSPPPAAAPPRAREFCRMPRLPHNGMELVTTTSLISELRQSFHRRSRQNRVGRAGPNAGGPCRDQRLSALHQRARRVDQIVHHQAMPAVPRRR